MKRSAGSGVTGGTSRREAGVEDGGTKFSKRPEYIDVSVVRSCLPYWTGKQLARKVQHCLKWLLESSIMGYTRTKDKTYNCEKATPIAVLVTLASHV
jgi:hypothetical protein